MMRTLRVPRIFLAAAALAATAGLASLAWAESGRCFDNWDEARPIIRANGLVSGKQVIELAKTRSADEFLKAQLCERDGGYVYLIHFLTGDGELKTLEYDAKDLSFLG